MGQTLTHGVYLPDEGERNCYNGLAANWQLLDNSVGTIAEHTTQIAGKAPAVHTHGKADITDLFNSANTWTKNNTYSADCIIYNSDNSGTTAGLKLRNSKAEVLSTGNTSSDQSMTFRDKNDVAIGYVKGAVQSASVALKIGAYAKDSSNNTVNTELQLLAYSNGNKAIIPSTTNTYDLGSSSYQWNNLYAKNYYYNGTAWGLDKSNVWTGNNTFTSTITTKTNVDRTVAPTSDSTYGTIICRDKNGSAMFRMQGTIKTDLSNVWDMMLVAPNSSYQTFFTYTINSATLTKELRLRADSVIPDVNSTADLGTSTNKWKTFNGINPGALSIFNPSASYDPIDIPTSWDTSGASWNTLSVSNLGDGWICITYYNCSAGDYILARFGGTNGSNYPSLRFDAVKASDNKYYIYALFPVAKAFSNIYLKMLINSNANLTIHRYIPAYGTV